MATLLSVDALAEALRPLLPQADAPTRLALARLVVGLAAGTLDPAEARQSLNQDPHLGEAYAALAGQELVTDGVPISFVGAQTGDVSVGDVAGGNLLKVGDIQVVLPPDEGPRPPAWWQRLRVHPAFLLLGALIPLVGLVSVIADIRGAGRQVDQWLAPFSIQPEQPGEVLILVAPFDQSENIADNRPHVEIVEALREEASQLQSVRVRVEQVSEAVPTERAEVEIEAARRLGDRYDASIIVWGSVTGVRTKVRFLHRKQIGLEVEPVRIDETDRSQQNAFIKPDAYAEFVTQDLPGQISFLTFFGLGQAALTAGDTATARALITTAVSSLEAVKTPPEGAATAYFYLGLFEQQPGESNSTSIDAYTKAIELDREFSAAYNNRGALYGDRGELDKALADYNKAIELAPGSAHIYYNRALLHTQLGEHTLALDDYTKVIELDPQRAAAYNNRGILYAGLGQQDKAFADYTRAIELDLQYADAYNNRGTLYSDKGQVHLALADYNKAIELVPGFAAPYVNRGNVYQDQGRFDEALADYTRAVELDPQLEAAYVNLGDFYAEQGNPDKALAEYTRALEINPEYIDAYYRRAPLYLAQDQPDQALADFTKAIEIAPDDARAYSSRGSVYANQSRFDEALTDFTKAIELDPYFARAYYNLGLIYRDMGHPELALAEFNQAIELDPQYMWAYNNRGLTYMDLGLPNDALADFTRVIELDPQYVAGYYNRAMIYEELSQTDLALADYHQVLKLVESSSDVGQAAQKQITRLSSQPRP